MNEQEPNLLPDEADDMLDRAIHAVLAQPLPQATRKRTIENAAAWRPTTQQNPQHRRSETVWIVAGFSVVFLMCISMSLYVWIGRVNEKVKLAEREQIVSNASESQQTRLPEIDAYNPDSTSIRAYISPPASASMLSYWTTSVRVEVAESAPIIVANGGDKPIHLGAWIPQRDAGVNLHVWDWSKSPMSRILPGPFSADAKLATIREAESWSNQLLAISPDGKQVVRASGDIFDLQTGKRTPLLDLGNVNSPTLGNVRQRISDLKLSPDGFRLAVLVKSSSESEPRLFKTGTIRIIEFPSGKPLCEFPAGEPYALRMGFSADSRQILVGDSAKQVIRRNATTGEELQQYVPALGSQIMATAFSPDVSLVAACESEGDVFIWNAASGELLHHLADPPFNGPHYGTFRFSPDGKYLAVHSGIFKVHVIEVATGKIISTVDQSTAMDIHWAADSKTFTAITPLIGGEGGKGRRFPLGNYDVYPAVHIWDWQNEKRVKSLTVTLPPIKK